MVLADEPTGVLDHNTGTEIMQLFSLLNKEGTAIILITHDEAVSCPYSASRPFVRISEKFLHNRKQLKLFIQSPCTSSLAEFRYYSGIFRFYINHSPR